MLPVLTTEYFIKNKNIDVEHEIFRERRMYLPKQETKYGR